MTTLKVKDLKRIIRETAENEFKPVLGKGVAATEKKNNSDAYKDSAKKIRGYMGKAQKSMKKKGTFDNSERENGGMSDLRYDGITPEFKKRAKAQLKGYVSAEAEKLHKNDDYGNAEYGTDDAVKILAKRAKEKKAKRDTAAEIGLTGRMLDKKALEGSSDTMFEGKIKRLTFRQPFLSEAHMMNFIPDSLKEENRRFVMRDSNETEYLVEWHKYMPDVTKKIGKKVVNEQLDKIKGLFHFSNDKAHEGTTIQGRLKEDRELGNMLNKARDCNKKK